jgi:hypothetical protein
LGTVRDPRGSVVPGASVKIINEQTGATRDLVSDERGDYVGLGFFVGSAYTYRVEAEMGGFQKVAVAGIQVRPEEKKRVDIILPLEVVTTTVQVTVTTSAIQTEGSTVNTSLAHALIDRPMENTSRAGWGYDPAMWLPGTSDGPNGFQLWGGVTKSQSEMQIEGQQAYIEAELAPQSVQDINVVTGTPSAEYGRPSSMNIVLRSGSNTLHAAFYETLYNPAVNAVNTINTVNKRPPGISQWRHEFNVAGPVYIPKVYDGRNKTFFFLGYWRSLYGSGLAPRTVSIPSPRLQQGDFSKYLDGNGNAIPIRDPLTGQPFSGNVIPQNRVSKSALAIEKDIYQDNFGEPFQYVGNAISTL